MNDMVIRMRVMILVVAFVCAVGVWLLPAGLVFEKQSPYLQVHFLDVGQGDAIFIETPSGVQVLVDGGPDASVLSVLAREMSFFDRTIDVLVGTHPDKDHIGGLIDVLKRYKIKNILTTENKGDTSTASLYNRLKTTEGAEVWYARGGQEIALDASTTVRILFPDSDPTEMESNTSSIVAQLIYGSTTFLLTGDSPKNIEEYLTTTHGERLKSTVLKVGHHGSRTSTSELFLDAVQPQFAIVTAKKDSRYGHPHVEVTDLLFNKRIEMLETSKEGSITFLSDGKKVWKER